VLIECVTLFWSPAKDATMPNLIPKNKLESGMINQLRKGFESISVEARK
jgi:dTMP kinase